MTEKSSKTKTADSLWRQIIKSEGKCKRGIDCKFGVFEASHIIRRGYKGLRWDLANGLCLCIGCHDWAHSNPKKFREWVKQQFPERWKYLTKRKYKIGKPDLDAVIKRLKSYLDSQ